PGCRGQPLQPQRDGGLVRREPCRGRLLLRPPGRPGLAAFPADPERGATLAVPRVAVRTPGQRTDVMSASGIMRQTHAELRTGRHEALPAVLLAVVVVAALAARRPTAPAPDRDVDALDQQPLVGDDPGLLRGERPAAAAVLPRAGVLLVPHPA